MKRNKSEMSIFLQSWNLLPQPNTLKSFFSGFLPRRFKLFCFKAFSIFLLLSALCSCNHSKKGVPVLFRDGVAPFAEVVNKVEFIPLETDSVHILGENPELWVEDSCFIVSDWQNASIFRYSLQGKFLNTIGRKGNGPDEFSGIDGWSYEDGLLTVFSYPDKVLNFSLSGELLSRRKISNLGMSSYMVGKDVLTYMGIIMYLISPRCLQLLPNHRMFLYWIRSILLFINMTQRNCHLIFYLILDALR